MSGENVLRISWDVYHRIRQTLGTLPPECGGVLGAGPDGVVTEFLFDRTGRSTPEGYAPDVGAINRVLEEDWMPRGILMVGIVHSHAHGIDTPSCMDVNYGMHILQALDTVDRFYLPIVTGSGESMRMSCYTVEQEPGGRCVCRKTEYAIADDNGWNEHE